MLVAVDELLTIGEFSARCGLSPKMLRSYAVAGLLSPAAVDRTSGYRFYGQGQIHAARAIALLRRAGVPVADIASFLAQPTTTRLDHWEQELDVETARRKQAFCDVREHLALDVEPADASRPRVTLNGGTGVPNLAAGAASDIGPVRARNQDAVLLDAELFAVADGMGSGGETASVIAVETLRSGFAANPTAEGLIDACREANRAVWLRAQSDPELTGMGTTLAAAGVVKTSDDEALLVVHVGDSRAYLLRNGELRRVTGDHSFTEALVRAGELTEQEARVHPKRSVLTRVLGMGPEVVPDAVEVVPDAGDRLLLCTDGLFNELEDVEISQVLSSGSAPGMAAEELVRLAVSRVGHDNASAVVIDMD